MTYNRFPLSYSSVLPRLAAAEGLFLFGVKKKQKTPSENFSFKVSGLAVSVEPEKFVRPDLSRTGIQCYGLVGRKCTFRINRLYLSDYKLTSMVAESKGKIESQRNAP